MLMDKATLIQAVKDELQAGIVNLELSDEIIERNLDKSLMISADYFNYTDYKTLHVTKTTGSSGYIELAEIDPNGIPAIMQVWPTTNVMNLDAALLGLGSIYINMGMALNPQLNAYSSMMISLHSLKALWEEMLELLEISFIWTIIGILSQYSISQRQ